MRKGILGKSEGYRHAILLLHLLQLRFVLLSLMLSHAIVTNEASLAERDDKRFAACQ